MAEPTLVVLPVSPWSERARWALDHHRIPYRVVEHAPFIGERRLRRLTGPGPARATVPLLITGEERLTESTAIARWADRHGSGATLFPEGQDAELERWCTIADQSSSAGRALVTAALLRDPAALDETHPRQIPRFVRPLLRPLTRHGTRWFAKKYALDVEDTSAAEAQLRASLDLLRQALASGGPYLLGTFSYADVTMATVLQGVKPVDHPRFPLGTATRRAWTQETLAAAHPELLTWRDELYRKHRS